MPSSRQTDQQDDHKDPFPCPKGHQTRENQQKETRLFGPREVYCAFSLNDKELKKATRTEMQQNMDLHGYKLLKNHQTGQTKVSLSATLPNKHLI